MQYSENDSDKKLKSFAIVVVGYNRIQGIKRLVESLEKVDFDGRNDIDLIFSIDNSGFSIVEEFANSYEWMYGKKIVRTFPERQGLKKHILQCGDYTNQYDIVVILEDDLYVSDSMYFYAYQAAINYWDDDRIAGVSLYSFQKNWLKWLVRFEPQKSIYDTFFMKIAMSWGQVWTGPKWNSFREWLEKNSEFDKSDSLPHVLNEWPESSWLKFHDLYCIKEDKYFIYPYVSISTNCSDVGEHAQFAVTDHQVELMYGKKKYAFPKYDEDAVIYDEFMEREGLGKYLGVQDSELSVDLWGNRPKKHYKRFVLSIETLPYKRVKEFSLSLRPIELSVIVNLKGKEIVLYDTLTVDETKKNKKDADYIRYVYSIRSNDYRKVLPFAIKLSRRFFNDVNRKIKRLVKKK